MTDIFGQDITVAEAHATRDKPKRKQVPNGYACRPGSGPAGETCETCVHSWRVQGGRKRYWKCALIKANWTNSYGTDIQLSAPACQLWKPAEVRTAKFSEDRAYRYTLDIVWDDTKALCQFIGLNPSTADEVKDDPTVRRCKDFCNRWGYGGLVMTNLFAFRATEPEDMKAHAQPIGEVIAGSDNFRQVNDEHLVHTSQRCDLVIAAWGNDGTFLDRASQVIRLIPNMKHLGLTKSGQPKHPLYLKQTTIPQPLTANA
jgi:hypothetical protein